LNGSKICKYVLLKWWRRRNIFCVVLDYLIDYDLGNICAKICAGMTQPMRKSNISTIGGASSPRRKYNGKCIAAFNGPK
jgi:hypothetical protein